MYVCQRSVSTILLESESRPGSLCLNHLAHLFLAPQDPESLIGNLAADSIKGRLGSELSARMAQAVRFHRAVDAFTDAHPAVARSRRRLETGHGHYTRIIIDVFYDHLLSRDWARYSPDESLSAFAARMYGILGKHNALIPEPMGKLMPRMIADDWLTRNLSMEGVARTLFYLSRRLKRPVALQSSIDDLQLHDADLESDFRSFFPEAIEISKKN